MKQLQTPANINALNLDRGSRAAHSVRAADGTELFVCEWGHGQPMVFVHAWALHSQMWQFQFLDFGGNFRCIAFDRRGHGRSGMPGSGYEMDVLADDLDAVLSQNDLQDVVLVGHSLGCAEIVRYVARHGTERLNRIVLLAPLTPCLTSSEDNRLGAPAEVYRATRQTWSNGFHAWIEQNKLPFFSSDTAPEVMDWMARMLGDAYLPAILASSRAVVEADLREDLKTFDVPTLVIQGDRDASAPLEMTGKPTAQGIRDARFVVYEGAPHGLFVTHRQRLKADILAFVAEDAS